MSASSYDRDAPPATGPEDYGAKPIPEGFMKTPYGLVPCLEEPGANGQANGAPVKGAELLLRDTCVDASMLQTYEPPPREWVVRYRIPAGEITLFSGPGGLGKSTLAMQLQVAMAAGLPWLGYQTTQGRSVAFYCEETTDEAARRMKTVRKRLGVSWEDMTEVSYHSLKGADMYLCEVDRYTSGVEPSDLVFAIQHEVERLDAKLLILDSLNRLFSGNENDRVQVTGFLRMLEHIAVESGVAILLLSHPSKSGEIDGSGYSGSTAWSSMVRSRCYLSYQRLDPEVASPEDLDNPLLILKWPKGNYAGKARDLEIERSLDPDDPNENPPIYEPVSEANQDGEALFLDAIDALNNAGQWPRTSATGRSKHLYAPVAVYQHKINRQSRKNRLTMEQASNLYTKLMSQGRLRVVEEKGANRHPVEVVKTAQAEVMF